MKNPLCPARQQASQPASQRGSRPASLVSHAASQPGRRLARLRASSPASVFPSTAGVTTPAVGVVSTTVAFAGAFALVAAGTATGTSAVAAPSAANCSLDGACACGSDPGTGFEWTAGEEAVEGAVEGAAGEAAVRAGSDLREGKSSMCSSTYFTRG